ncbi:MAG: TatD family hydrolase [Burkholderiales bacterium]|nr:TatD family hydrolase [Burkholderiales bacterium]
MQLVDSHCHLDFPEFAGRIPSVLERMAENAVTHALCVSVTREGFPGVLALAAAHANLFASAGVHPDYPEAEEPSVAEIVRWADHPKVVAIGETGLDYYRLQGDLEWQRRRFRTHIRAARECGKPLIVHTRAAAADTLAIMAEERASDVGGVMHCFTETADVARAAMEMGFLVSFSGIVTFKNAAELKAVARSVPLARMLVETDAPYLAPVPHRGRVNEPAYVRHVAEEVARLHGVDTETVAAATTRNFFGLFRGAARFVEDSRAAA